MRPAEPADIDDGAGWWQRGADRLARVALVVLLIAVVTAIVGGVLYTAFPSGSDPEPPPVEECENPPCFGGGGLPPASAQPVVLPVLGYLLTILFGLPSVLVGVWRPHAARVRRSSAGSDWNRGGPAPAESLPRCCRPLAPTQPCPRQRTANGRPRLADSAPLAPRCGRRVAVLGA